MTGPRIRRRYVRLGDGRRVTLGAYVRAVKIAKANPDRVFARGLRNEWWGATGRQIVDAFWAGVVDRINAGVPYSERGMA